MANQYMTELGKEIDHLSQIKLTDSKVIRMMEDFYPVSAEMSDGQKKNNQKLLEDMKQRYFDAPDLSSVGRNGYRFINAVFIQSCSMRVIMKNFWKMFHG